RHDARGEAQRSLWIAFDWFGMNTDAVAHSETGMISVEHGHGLLFACLFPPLKRGALPEGRLVIWRLHDQFGLEDPGRVAARFGFTLLIDQEERHYPHIIRAPYQSPDNYVRLLFRFGTPGLDWSHSKGNELFAAHLLPFPHRFRLAS